MFIHVYGDDEIAGLVTGAEYIGALYNVDELIIRMLS